MFEHVSPIEIIQRHLATHTTENLDFGAYITNSRQVLIAFREKSNARTHQFVVSKDTAKDFANSFGLVCSVLEASEGRPKLLSGVEEAVKARFLYNRSRRLLSLWDTLLVPDAPLHYVVNCIYRMEVLCKAANRSGHALSPSTRDLLTFEPMLGRRELWIEPRIQDELYRQIGLHMTNPNHTLTSVGGVGVYIPEHHWNLPILKKYYDRHYTTHPDDPTRYVLKK